MVKLFIGHLSNAQFEIVVVVQYIAPLVASNRKYPSHICFVDIRLQKLLETD
jgi:hypothetical protein